MKTFSNEEKEFLINIFRNEFMYQCKFFNKREIKDEDFNDLSLLSIKEAIDTIINSLLDSIPTNSNRTYRIDKKILGENTISGFLLDGNTIALKFFSKTILDTINYYKECEIDNDCMEGYLVVGIKIYLEPKDILNIYPISSYEEYKYNLNKFIKKNVKIIYIDSSSKK